MGPDSFFICERIMERFYIEEEEGLEAGCRCFSCWIKTGRFLVKDRLDLIDDEAYPKKEFAEKICNNLNVAISDSPKASEEEMNMAWDIIFDLINLRLIPCEIPIEDEKLSLAQKFISKRIANLRGTCQSME
jgi:hypothetical protein